MITFAADKATARIAGEFYVNAINVMRGASTRLDLSRPAASRKPSTSSTGCSKRPSCSACRSRKASPAVSRSSPEAPAASAAPPRRGYMREGACVVLADIDREALDIAVDEFGNAFGKDNVRGAIAERHREEAVASAFATPPGIRRRRHPRLECRHLLFGSPSRIRRSRCGDRNMDILATGYFLVVARGVPALEDAGHRRRDRVHRLEERPRRLPERRRLLHGQGRRDASRALPRAGRRAARHPRQRRQSGRGAARLEDLDGRMARAARRRLQDEARRARGALPQTQPAPAQRAA